MARTNLTARDDGPRKVRCSTVLLHVQVEKGAPVIRPTRRARRQQAAIDVTVAHIRAHLSAVADPDDDPYRSEPAYR